MLLFVTYGSLCLYHYLFNLALLFVVEPSKNSSSSLPLSTSSKPFHCIRSQILSQWNYFNCTCLIIAMALADCWTANPSIYWFSSSDDESYDCCMTRRGRRFDQKTRIEIYICCIEPNFLSKDSESKSCTNLPKLFPLQCSRVGAGFYYKKVSDSQKESKNWQSFSYKCPAWKSFRIPADSISTNFNQTQ